MAGTKWATKFAMFSLAILLFSFESAKSADEKTYDLRGPAPIKGQVFINKSSFKIKNGGVKLKAGGMVFDAKQTVTASDEEEVKIIAVEGRQVTKAQTKVTRDQAETTTTLGGQDMSEKKPGELEGEVIISERSPAGKWKHSLVDNKPTDKQKKELDRRVGPECQDELYPEGKIKVGHTWTVDASALQRIFGGSMTDLKGKLKMKFVKVEMVDGVECAVIEEAGTITGIAKTDDGDLDLEMELKGTTWRAIASGIDVKDRAEGKMTMSGKIDMDGNKVDISVSGPVVLESTSKLKSAKPE